MTRKDPDYLRDIVECAILTGMRKGEILSMRWDQIRDGFIYLRETKTNEPRQIPINETLDEVLKRIRRKQHLTSDYVFTYLGKSIKDVKTAFNAAVNLLNRLTVKDNCHKTVTNSLSDNPATL